MMGARTFLSLPPEKQRNPTATRRKYVLLTAADGIDCSFQLLVVDLDGWGIRLQSASTCGKWGHSRYVSTRHIQWRWKEWGLDPAVLSGRVIHWLVCNEKQILSYDLGTGKLGLVKLPPKLPPTNCGVNQLHLATSSDGKLLKLLVIEGFMMSMWLQLTISPTDGSGWSLETVINMEEKLRSLYPDITPNNLGELVIFDYSVKGNDDVVFLRVSGLHSYDTVIVFYLETMDMHTQEMGDSLLEIDLPSYLKNMKIFS
jgi:hypothetical protein